MYVLPNTSTSSTLSLYSSIATTDLSILLAVALPYGIYDNVYHKLADTTNYAHKNMLVLILASQ